MAPACFPRRSALARAFYTCAKEEDGVNADRSVTFGCRFSQISCSLLFLNSLFFFPRAIANGKVSENRTLDEK